MSVNMQVKHGYRLESVHDKKYSRNVSCAFLTIVRLLEVDSEL